MMVRHHHSQSAATLHSLAAFGLNQICIGHLSANMDELSVDALTRLRKHVEYFGIALDAVWAEFYPVAITNAIAAIILIPILSLAWESVRGRTGQAV